MKTCIIVPESPYLYDPWTIEPLGALYIAKSVAHLNDEVYVRVWKQDPIPHADWYGISVVTPHYEQVRQIIRWIRDHASKARIVLGGAHCTFIPLSTMYDLQPDFVVAGEGDIAFPAILSGDWEGMSGIYTNAPGHSDSGGLAPVPDIKTLPIPDRSILLHEYHPNPTFSDERGGAIAASRGCPHGCSYCGKSVGKKLRWRDPIQVAEEMELYRQWRIEDDDIFGNVEWLKALAECVPSNTEWRCSVRASSVTREILDVAIKAGCRQVGVGIETCNPALLKKHCPSKSVEENTRATLMIKESGLMVTAFLIAGLPGETSETMQDTINWIEEVQPDKFTVSACTPYPGSPLWYNPEKYGITKLDHVFADYRQLGREEEDAAFVFDTEQVDRYELTRLWKRLREVTKHGIAKKK